MSNLVVLKCLGNDLEPPALTRNFLFKCFQYPCWGSAFKAEPALFFRPPVTNGKCAPVPTAAVPPQAGGAAPRKNSARTSGWAVEEPRRQGRALPLGKGGLATTSVGTSSVPRTTPPGRPPPRRDARPERRALEEPGGSVRPLSVETGQAASLAAPTARLRQAVVPARCGRSPPRPAAPGSRGRDVEESARHLRPVRLATDRRLSGNLFLIR
jgi:hypothetical protein